MNPETPSAQASCSPAAANASANDLLAEVYAELRALAAHKLASEKAGQTLQATALVHEAWIRMGAGRQPDSRWQNRTHFFATAAEAMRRILIDNARRKRAARHGGDMHRVPLDDAHDLIAAPAGDDDEVLAVHEALDWLAASAPDKAEIVKLKYFVGLTTKQIADVLGVAEPTVKRRWAFARAWLFREIRERRAAPTPPSR